MMVSSPVTLGSKELYQGLDVCDAYPTNKLFTYLDEIYHQSSTVVQGFDFSGIEQVTDEVVHVLVSVATQNNGESALQDISFAACTHLTDYGIYRLAKCFKNIRKISLDGCIKVTERGLHYLLTECQKLEVVSLKGANVGYVPATRVGLKLSLEGCPIYNDLRNAEDTIDYDISKDKAIVMCDASLQLDVVAYLRGDHVGEISKRAPGGGNMKLHTSIVTYEFCGTEFDPCSFMTDGAVYIYAFDVGGNLGNPQVEIMSRLDSARAQVLCVPFIILAFHTESKESKSAIDNLTKTLSTAMTSRGEYLKNLMEKEKVDSRERDFQFQQHYSRGLQAEEFHQMDPIYFFSIEKDTKHVEYCALKQEVGGSNQTLEDLLKVQEELTNKASASIDNLRKSDISEIASMSSPPQALLKVAQGLLVLLGKADSLKSATWKLFKPMIRNMSFLNELRESLSNPGDFVERCKKITPLMNDPDLNEQRLRNVSIAGHAFYICMTTVYQLSTEHWPKISKLQTDLKEKMEIQNKHDHTAIQFSLETCEKYVRTVYQWESYEFSQAVHSLYSSLPKVKMMNLEEYVQSLSVKPFGDGMGPYRKAVQRLANMGKVLFYPNIAGEPIIFDVQWFMDIMDLKHKDKKLENRDRVLSLTRYAQLYEMGDLEEAWKDHCTGNEFSAVLSIMQHFGVVLQVKTDVPKNTEPDWYYVFFRDVPPKMYLWSNPRQDQLSGLGERIFNTDNPDDTEGLVSNYYYVKHFWPDQKPDTDLEVTYSYNLDNGFPSVLIPQIVAKLHEMFDVKFCCQTCAVVGQGAVEAKIKYNVHGTRITGSIDIEARCTRFSQEREANEYIIHQYMWGLVNSICLCIEGLIISYPLLHSHVVIPCLGSCAQTVYRYRYSPLELPRDITSEIPCPSCKEERMSPLAYGLLLGRHAYLPYHDWKEELGTKRCRHCGISEVQSEKFWAMESSLYPTFRSQTFEFITAETSQPEQKELSETRQESSVELFLSCQPLCAREFKAVRFLVLDSKGVELHIIRDVECITRLKRGETDDFTSNLQRAGDMTMNLAGMIIKKFTGEDVKEEHEALKCLPGDVLHLDVKCIVSEDGWETNDLLLIISKNGCAVVTVGIQTDSFLAITAEDSFMTESGPKLVMQTPMCPVVTSRHFNVNTLVVYDETGIGGQWAVGTIQSISNGYLYVSQDKHKRSSARKIHPNSEDLSSLCQTPGDKSITIGKELVKRPGQVYEFLNETKTLPAPIGLFRHVIRNTADIDLLPLKGRLENHPVQCTAGTYTPLVLARTIENSIMMKNRLSPVSMLFLPSNFETHHLYHPSRHVVHDLTNQAVTQVCAGDVISRRNAVYHASHLMNAPVIPLADVDGVTSAETGQIWRALVAPFLEGYQRLMAYPPLFKVWNKILSQVKEDFEEGLMRKCLSRLMALYYETMLLLMAVNTDIEMNPEMRQAEADVYTIKINKAFEPREDLENGQCESHRCIDWKLVIDAENLRAIKLSADTKADIAMEIFRRFPNLVTVDLSGCHFKTLSGIGLCNTLENLDMSENDFEELPAELEKLKGTLRSLNLHTNPLKRFPDFISEFSKLEILDVGNTLIRSLPQDFGNLSRLRMLSLENTAVVNLPESFRKLRYLTYLNLKGVLWMAASDMPHRSMTMEKYMSFVSNRKWSYNMAVLHKEEKEELYNACNPTDGGFTSRGTYDMQERMFKMFPRLGVDNEDSADISLFGGVPSQIFSCRNLTYLNLSNQGLKVIPDMIGKLNNLQQLLIMDNPHLVSVSGEVAKTPIESLNLTSCPSLKTPPQEIIRQNSQTLTIAYLRRLAAGSVTCYRTKLMLVGLGEAGKTSLIRALMSDKFKTTATSAEGITDGIDIKNWQVTRSNLTLTYSVWDFAGQTVYYNTHQFFLSKRAIYILVWNMRLGFEHAGLDFWLNSIQCHAPETPVFIVGTHADEVSRSELPSEEFMRKFSNITGFFYISSKTGQGVSDFYDKLIETTFLQPYMGERIPEAWFNFEKNIISRRQSGSLLLWEDIEKEASRSAVFGNEIKQAVQFIHDLGSLQHFDSDFLRNRVVINPQWIVDVMACVVSVHNDVNKHGYLDHKDIATIWKDYDSELHDWLLRLTELFDLTFPLADQDVNVVPCLLPQTEPEIEWPTKKEGVRKAEMLYRFESLPAGLFNRAQVRLYQFSDGSSMWKRGSVLRKNDHMAAITMEGESEVLVRAQGTRPENMILLVHEVFEGLILEFFRGVKYEYLMPCPDCLKADAKHPTMFPSSVLRRAVEMKAMHLQCHAFFHSLATSEVQAMMPPEASEDYEVHMNNMVHDLEDLQNQLPFDTCILYCKADVPQEGADAVHPRQVKNDLEKKGFNVWYQDDLHSMSVDDVIKAMSSSKTVITFVSDSFVLDTDCQRMFQFAQQSLKKPILLVMTGKGRKWQQSVIGMRTAHQVYVNMQRAKQYESKLQELVTQVSGKVGKKKVVKGADVFVSYCWTNSAQAVAIGHAVEKAGSLGHGDPRQLKEFLESEGFSAWIDFENVGVNGLFSDIAESLKKCRVVVACVSDEYAMSPNCQMEFRFAHVTLKKPIILAVVGTGYSWESTEVGLLSLGYPKMNFQVANNIAFSQLRESVADSLASLDCQKDGKSSAPQGTQKQSAFQELYELAQRKFLRQLVTYTNHNSNYPRLFVLDLQEPTSVSESGGSGIESVEIDLKDDDQPSDKPHDGPGEYCFRVLCEHEGGWHAVHEGFPISMIQDEMTPLLHLTAPFFARILSILKHSNINLQCLNSTQGDAFIKILEQRAGVNVDVRPFYQAIRNHIIRKDVTQTFGGLARCYLPSGKFLWLCPEHQKLPRVSKLEVIVSDPAPHDTVSDYQLIEDLKVYQELVTVKPQGNDKPTTAAPPSETPSECDKPAKEDVKLPSIKEEIQRMPAVTAKPARSPAKPSSSSGSKPAKPSSSSGSKPAATSKGFTPPKKVERSKSIACTVQ
ncbi:uncharacterized protein LOC135487048 [Lineus longissimus]|uniref:uncharacterized protein LOC135487048 n=1 Tax=Lineus longissimus TaxID=88925 RepID=UPI002B4E81DC